MTGRTESSNGVVSVATGSKYIGMAAVTLAELRRIEPEVPITLFVDDVAHAVGLFDGVELVALEHPRYSWDDKIEACRRSPYRKTVFLDTDVLAIRPFFADLVAALDWSTVLARSSGIGFNFGWETITYTAAIPQFNTGVIAFNSDTCAPLWRSWERLRIAHPEGHDQPTFRAATIETGIVVSELPPAYNHLTVNLAVAPVRLLHCVSTKSRLIDPVARRRMVDRALALKTPCVDFEGMTVLRGRAVAPEFPATMAGYLLGRLYRRVRRRLQNLVRRRAGA